MHAFRFRQLFAALLLLGGLATLLVSIVRGAHLERADFVFVNGAEVSSLDPASVSGVPEGRVMYSLYEGLTSRDPRTLAPLPGMADRWEVSPDGITYTFHIRDDARWSNGDPLTARDFEWSWQRLLHPETASEYSYQLWYLENARAYSFLPMDLGDEERWWFDSRTFVNWNADGSRVRVGVHGFSGLSPTDAAAADAVQAVRARLDAAGAELRANPTPDASDPYGAGWLFEGSLEAPALEAALPSPFLPEPRAREELFWPQVGARATDEHTFVVTLASPTPFFLTLTSFYPLMPTHRATWEWARETYPGTWQIEWISPEHLVTNGPFVLESRRINDRIRLRKNPLYWDAENVAFRTIDVLAVEHYVTMLNMYLTGQVDWIDRCAPNLIPRMMPREDFNPESYLGTYFYRVNVHRPPLDDKRVRRALALTINRRAICEKIMKKGEKPLYSLCPDGLPGYPRPEMRHTPFAPDFSDYDAAFARDCDEARRLLAEAGFGPGGKDIPSIEIHYNTSESHRDIAEVIADTWKRELDVDARLLNQEWKVYLDTQNTINFDVSRSAWIGDYPDPNTFVDLFVTGGENNRTGWGNPRYDELVASAAEESDPTRRLALLAEAEAILLDELPILPIYSYVSQNIVNPRLGGFFPNVMDDHFPKFWYWMSDEELAEKRAAQPADWILVPAPGPAAGLFAPAGPPPYSLSGGTQR
ncbi:MAG TPA: peptide ABC transporter substrate-binding protein [Planctomycetes bacterium]|nr:peptide ABC transporter substrate-binding protein [Planctomycetota bacterium]